MSKALRFTLFGVLSIASLSLITAVIYAQTQIYDAGIHLKHVDTFAFGGVGFAGHISGGEKDFNFIAAQQRTQALASLEDVFANGTPEAKSYALVGIRALDPVEYQKLKTVFARSVKSLSTMHGCIVDTELSSGVLKEIDAGAFDAYVTKLTPRFSPERSAILHPPQP